MSKPIVLYNSHVILYHLTQRLKLFINLGKKRTPRVGLEPTTPRLTAVCSTIELSRNTKTL